MRRLPVILSFILHCVAAQAAADLPGPGYSPASPLHERVMHLPGDRYRPAALVVTLFTPDGPGPFPLAVMNHGSNGDANDHAAAPRDRFTLPVFYFLSRGYAVAVPMMRGFAGSAGAQGSYDCEFDKLAIDNGRDIAGVIESLSRFPEIDGTRIVVAGQGFGGWNTLGLGALHPKRVRGLIDFFGGVQSSGCNGIETDGLALIQAADRLGAYTLLPSLWFYGENDSLFGPRIWRPMHAAYARHGADAELVDIGVFMDDSHKMLSWPESIPLWAPRIDAFLSRIGLPGHELYPRYMPRPWPTPSHFAAIDDVAAVPWINEQQRSSYRKFLAMSFPRAFLISPGGASATAQGCLDPVTTAQSVCRRAGVFCLPYAVDNDVVFVAPPAAPRTSPTHFAALDDVGALPWVNDKGRAAYAHFLTRALPRAFFIGTAGQTIDLDGVKDPASRAMAICNNLHIECRPYAVDNDVVWETPPAPAKPPRATHFAALDDVGAVPWVKDRSRAAYENFLKLPLPRAFAIASGGQAATTQGGYDPLRRALEICRKAGLECRPYAVDDHVVWVRPTHD